MTPRVCVVAMATTLDDLRRQRDAAVDADLVELRLDRLDGPIDVAGALSGRRTPVIVTCRARWEGGGFAGSEDERYHILAQALAHGAEYVDVEWRAGFTDLLRVSDCARVVLSSHDFDGVPDDLLDRARAMRATGAGIVKLASMTTCLRDSVRVLEAARGLDAPGASIFIAMGPSGEVSRVCASRFGSAWTYAGGVGGIGQIDPATLIGRYRFRAVTSDTPLFGVLGRPVSHSVSPAMHNAAFGATGLDGVYLSFPASDVDDFMAFARAFGVAGASVTIPFKVAIGERVPAVDPLARQVGAVNTLRATGDGWEGRNTDVAGFLRPLRDRQVAVAGARVAIAGAGGSARAVITGLLDAGAHVTVHARDAAKARALAVACQVGAGAWPVPPGSWDVLVNCTPLGMYPTVDASPVSAEDLAGRSGRTVYDLIYNPLETRLLRDAARAGCDTIGGLDMLVAQAQEQFHWWTGVRPDAEVMRAAAVAQLAEFTRS